MKIKDNIEALKVSAEGPIGPILPPLMDATGTKIIDGRKRMEANIMISKEDKRWSPISLPYADEEWKIAAIDLISNANRQSLSKKERREKVVALIESWKAKTGKILTANDLHEIVGLSVSWFYKNLPDEYKDKVKVEAGSAGHHPAEKTGDLGEKESESDSKHDYTPSLFAWIYEQMREKMDVKEIFSNIPLEERKVSEGTICPWCGK